MLKDLDYFHFRSFSYKINDFIFLQSPKPFFESFLAFLFENTNFYKYAVTFENSHKIFKKTKEHFLRSVTGRKIDG